MVYGGVSFVISFYVFLTTLGDFFVDKMGFFR